MAFFSLLWDDTENKYIIMNNVFIGISVLLGLVAMQMNTFAEAQFENLNFEAATIDPIISDDYGRVKFTKAFPGWEAYVGMEKQELTLYDSIFLDSSSIGIFDSTIHYGSSFTPFEGKYTAMLEAGLKLYSSQEADVSLSQTGIIPTYAHSVIFQATLNDAEPGPFCVSINQDVLPLVQLKTTSDYSWFGANVEKWSGKSANLKFTLHSTYHKNGVNMVYLDGIRFLDYAVPEPATIMLTFIGLCLVMSASRLKQRNIQYNVRGLGSALHNKQCMR